jgi:hypothetical protein
MRQYLFSRRRSSKNSLDDLLDGEARRLARLGQRRDPLDDARDRVRILTYSDA